MENKQISKTRVKRWSRFALVGAFNTGLDFAVLNALVFGLALPKVGANIISSSAAMIFSYMLNHRFVFRSDKAHSTRLFITFIVITAAGLYVLQSAVIYFFAHVFTAPAHLLFEVADWMMPGVFSREFAELNFAKALATVASLLWNYVLYSRYVFKKTDQPD